jgi:SagB-type dehydrogenase family enzyme
MTTVALGVGHVRPLSARSCCRVCPRWVVETPGGTIPVRMAPSAGSLQPVNLYVAATRVTGLEPGVHYYDPARHALNRVRATDPRPALAAGCMQDFVATSPATLILTCSLDRVLWHYGSRAYRSVHLDAGVQAHNLMLVATALGLASCAIFGDYDDHIDHLTGIDGRNEITALLLAIGHQARSGLSDGP